jgi:hypothetical protein
MTRKLSVTESQNISYGKWDGLLCISFKLETGTSRRTTVASKVDNPNIGAGGGWDGRRGIFYW